ncbi:hypothetical protein [Paenisporosarcina sp.]|uniref:hypothetical protein n=1 Tax=Paenisporosarcina sp. TaxID=1932001 RepID=UPI003C740219
MILYHAVTMQQLLHCIIDKELIHKEQVCYIILSDLIKEEFSLHLEGLFFEKVFMINTHHFFNDIETNFLNSNELVGKFLNENRINPHEFSEIIVASPDSFFGMYLAKNEINFTILESELKSSPEYKEVNEGNCLITRKMCNLDNQVESMRKMDCSHLEEVLVLFGIDQKIEIEKDSTILLTQSPTTIIPFEEQKNLYQLVVDYFVPESDTKLVILPHPDDLMFYNCLFPQATVITNKFPSELIPFVFNERPQTVMSISPTTAKNIMGYFENHIKFSNDFERYFHITHRYYCALRLISMIHADYEIYEINSDKLLLKNLLNFSENQFDRNILSVNTMNEIPSKSIVIIDDFIRETFSESKDLCNFLKSIDSDSIVIFINSNKKYLFYDYPDKEIFKSTVPVEIHHISTIDETDQYSETFFVYSKRKDTRNMINQQEFEKSLRSSKKIIKVNALSEDQLRIKLLEGILEATEKRLEHYIKMESELREKLNKWHK